MVWLLAILFRIFLLAMACRGFGGYFPAPSGGLELYELSAQRYECFCDVRWCSFLFFVSIVSLFRENRTFFGFNRTFFGLVGHFSGMLIGHFSGWQVAGIRTFFGLMDSFIRTFFGLWQTGHLTFKCPYD